VLVAQQAHLFNAKLAVASRLLSGTGGQQGTPAQRSLRRAARHPPGRAGQRQRRSPAPQSERLLRHALPTFLLTPCMGGARSCAAHSACIAILHPTCCAGPLAGSSPPAACRLLAPGLPPPACAL
jgi:hypothetical protein